MHLNKRESRSRINLISICSRCYVVPCTCTVTLASMKDACDDGYDDATDLAHLQGEETIEPSSKLSNHM